MRQHLKSPRWVAEEMQRTCALLAAVCMTNTMGLQVSAIWNSTDSNVVTFNSSAFMRASPTIYSAANLSDAGAGILQLDWFNRSSTTQKTDSSSLSQQDITVIAVVVICLCILILLCYCWCTGWCRGTHHTRKGTIKFPKLREVRARITTPPTTYAFTHAQTVTLV